MWYSGVRETQRERGSERERLNFFILEKGKMKSGGIVKI